jgi:hypothetical protein
MQFSSEEDNGVCIGHLNFLSWHVTLMFFVFHNEERLQYCTLASNLTSHSEVTSM